MGFVSRMDTLQAVVLNYRMDKLLEVIEKRRANARLYQDLLWHDASSCRLSQEEFNTFHTFVIQATRRDELQSHLCDRGIKIAIHIRYRSTHNWSPSSWVKPAPFPRPRSRRSIS